MRTGGSKVKTKIPVEIASDYGVENIMITEWYKNSGDRVEKNENLCHLDLGKWDGDLPAPESGTLEILIHAEETLEGGGKKHIIATIEKES